MPCRRRRWAWEPVQCGGTSADGSGRVAGLQRLASVPGVRQVVPGHGHVGDGAEFRRRLTLDFAYLDAVESGKLFSDPRLTAESAGWLHDTHDEQVRYFQR